MIRLNNDDKLMALSEIVERVKLYYIHGGNALDVMKTAPDVMKIAYDVELLSFVLDEDEDVIGEAIYSVLPKKDGRIIFK